MKMSGSQVIDAPREAVWKGLNDPKVLQQCIPGCESIVASSPTQMKAKVVLKIGPVKASFTGCRHAFRYQGARELPDFRQGRRRLCGLCQRRRHGEADGEQPERNPDGI